MTQMTNDEAKDVLGSILDDLETLRGRANLVVESLPEDDELVGSFCDLEAPWSITQHLRETAISLAGSYDASSLVCPAPHPGCEGVSREAFLAGAPWWVLPLLRRL